MDALRTLFLSEKNLATSLHPYEGIHMRMEHSFVVDRPVETVWSFVSTISNATKISPKIVSATEISKPPLRVGSTFHEVIKEGRKNTTYLGTVTELREPHFLGFRLESWGCGKEPVPGTRSKYALVVKTQLTPQGGSSTKVVDTFECDMSSAGVFFRAFFSVMAPFMKPFLGKMMREQALATKKAIESGG